MKKLFFPLIILGISAILAASCSKGNAIEVIDGSLRSCFATIIHNPGISDSSVPPFYLVADDSTLMKSMHTEGIPAAFQNVDNARVQVTYLADFNSNPRDNRPFEIKIKKMEVVPIGKITASSLPDTLPKGLIQPLNIWYSGGVYNTGRFITINFLYTYLGGVAPDQFNIILSESGKDDSGYYCFTMASKIISNNSGVTSFISFPLEKRHTASDVKGFKIRFYTFEKKYHEVTVDY